MTSRLRQCRALLAGFAALAGLYGCVTVPSGPAVAVLPGQYKPFDQFRIDDLDCRQFASGSIGAATQATTDHATATAAGSTLIGAATGAAIGSVSGQAGPGAAIGAGLGLLVGATAGSNYAGASSYQLQQRYDGAYVQCMYARGNQIPARAAPAPRVVYGYPPGTVMAPPPGSQPAPPPRY